MLRPGIGGPGRGGGGGGVGTAVGLVGAFAGAAEEGAARTAGERGARRGHSEEGAEGGEAGADDAGAGFEGEPDGDVGLVVWGRVSEGFDEGTEVGVAYGFRRSGSNWRRA